MSCDMSNVTYLKRIKLYYMYKNNVFPKYHFSKYKNLYNFID